MTSFFPGLRRLAVTVLALLLAACAVGPGAVRQPIPTTAPVDGIGLDAPAVDSTEAFAALAAREAVMLGLDDWQLRGRLALARGGDGGTLNVEWSQSGEAYIIRLSAPVTRRQWVLSGSAESVLLSGVEGGPIQGTDAEMLLLEATGWRLPIRQLPFWVRGRLGPGPVSELAIDAEGRPLGFRQGAWSLAYRDWWPGDPVLPRRVFASTDDASVRLIVTDWTASGSVGQANGSEPASP